MIMTSFLGLHIPQNCSLKLTFLFQAQGENQKAISELVKYLKDFMADGEAWMELCDLYILEQDYAKAAFCCEELILQHPHNHLYYQR